MGPMDHAAAHGHFVRDPIERLASKVLAHTAELVDHRAGPDDGGPEIRLALALAHSGLKRLGADGLPRKHSDPELAFTAQEVAGGDTTGFELPGRNPPRLQRLEPELTKGDGVTSGGLALDLAPLRLAEFRPLGH